MSDTTDTTKNEEMNEEMKEMICGGECGKVIPKGDDFHHVEGANYCRSCYNANMLAEMQEALSAVLDHRS